MDERLVTHVFTTTIGEQEVLSVGVELPDGEPVPVITDAVGNIYVYEGIAPDDDDE